jgi:preprotein translocase subunit SecD
VGVAEWQSGVAGGEQRNRGANVMWFKCLLVWNLVGGLACVALSCEYMAYVGMDMHGAIMVMLGMAGIVAGGGTLIYER